MPWTHAAQGHGEDIQPAPIHESDGCHSPTPCMGMMGKKHDPAGGGSQPHSSERRGGKYPPWQSCLHSLRKAPPNNFLPKNLSFTLGVKGLRHFMIEPRLRVPGNCLCNHMDLFHGLKNTNTKPQRHHPPPNPAPASHPLPSSPLLRTRQGCWFQLAP